ncbi:MAG: hypothetical protein N3E47_00975 [Candidatus Bathyarchaeota archaeon]|nr:hypothetical protein [Candidatus Bathyarchaeota archaeon]
MLEREGKYKSVSFRKLVNEIPSTTHATFGLYRYPAKFIPQVISFILKNYARPKMKVFDPFAGYGTVGVVARIYDCDYELWDLNPLLEVLHAVATLKPKNIGVISLLHQIECYKEEFIPRWSNLYYWYPEDFLPFLFKVWGFYHSLEDEYIKHILVIPLLKVTRYFSYDDIQRQKLSKSPKSEQRIKSLLKSDWKTVFFQMLRKEITLVLERIHEYQKYSPKDVNSIVKGGVDTLSEDLREEKDILITSPPYLQSHEYIRQAKMDLFWLGFSEDYINRLSKLEIPYRNVPPQPIYSQTYLQWRSRIKEHRLLKIFDNYFWGVLGALTRLQKKMSSYMFLFVGRASIRGSPVPIDQIFAEHFSSLGWIHETTLMDTIVARRLFSYKINPATGIRDNRTPTENLVILKKL